MHRTHGQKIMPTHLEFSKTVTNRTYKWDTNIEPVGKY